MTGLPGIALPRLAPWVAMSVAVHAAAVAWVPGTPGEGRSAPTPIRVRMSAPPARLAVAAPLPARGPSLPRLPDAALPALTPAPLLARTVAVASIATPRITGPATAAAPLPVPRAGVGTVSGMARIARPKAAKPARLDAAVAESGPVPALDRRTPVAVAPLVPGVDDGRSLLAGLIHDAISRGKRYPAVARRQGREGTATVGFALGPDGAAREVGVLHSSGFGALDRAAAAAVRRASPFDEARRLLRGTEVFTVQVSFRLAGSR